VVSCGAGCTESPEERIPLTVILAGSLIYPFEEIEAAFEEEHPGIDVRLEG
jgi:molybdate/tungstate transport system substrate-binding protein